MAAAAALALVVSAGGALADLGDLGFQACIEDRVEGAPPEECATTTRAMNGARAVAEGGRGVYVASFLDNAVVHFNRGEATGSLTPHRCFKDTTSSECRPRRFPGTEGANSAHVPNDLKTLFVTAEGDNTVTAYDIHTPSGGLARRNCIEDPDSGSGDCPDTAEGLDGASSTAAYQESAYVASSGDDALVRLERNTHSSEIARHSCVEDTPRDEGCDVSAPGLNGARSVVVTRRGKTVYVAGKEDDAVATFPRHQSTGRLMKGSCIGDAGTNGCASTAPGLDGAYTLALSKDDQSLYVASEADDAIVHFERNPTTGLLEFRDCIQDDNDVDAADRECGAVAPGLDGARGLAVSYDGRSVYATANLDHTIAVFSRDPSTGQLTSQGCIGASSTTACGASAAGISRPNSITVSIDGNSAYVAGYDDDAVVHFSRDEASGRLAPAP